MSYIYAAFIISNFLVLTYAAGARTNFGRRRNARRMARTAALAEVTAVVFSAFLVPCFLFKKNRTLEQGLC